MNLFRCLSRALPALALLGGASAFACDTASDIVGEALSSHWGYDFLADLTTDIGPRMAGSRAGREAAAWAAKRLKKAGFDEVHFETFPVTYWERGAEAADIVQPRRQPLAVAALGHSVPTPAGGVEAEVVVFKSFQALLDAPKGSLNGKIAAITQKTVRTQTLEGYGTVARARVTGASEAARRGAVALVIRSIGTDNHRIAHTGLTHYFEDAPQIPAAAISNPDADLLERMAAKGPVKLRLKLENKSVPSEAVTVVGEIKGREHPEQVVLLSGHLDSWDQGTGAIDDGAGVAIAAGAAKVIIDQCLRPSRTIRVVLFGAEEIGGGLVDAYEAAHAAEAANIVIAGESDFGAGRIYNAALPAGSQGSPFAKELAAALLPLGIDMLRAPSSYGGGDIEGIHEKDGVPLVDFGQDGTTYFDIHHTPDDTLDKVDPAELAQNIAVWASFAWLAADSDVDFRAK